MPHFFCLKIRRTRLQTSVALHFNSKLFKMKKNAFGVSLINGGLQSGQIMFI